MFLFERDTTNNVFFFYIYIKLSWVLNNLFFQSDLLACLLQLYWFSSTSLTQVNTQINKQINKQTKHTCPSKVEFVFPPQYLAIEKAVNVNLTLVGTLWRGQRASGCDRRDYSDTELEMLSHQTKIFNSRGDILFELFKYQIICLYTLSGSVLCKGHRRNYQFYFSFFSRQSWSWLWPKPGAERFIF